MKIWIDGYEANVGQRLGSSQVAFELIRTLERIDSKNDYTILLPSPPLGDLPPERPGWKYKILKPLRLWTRIALPAALYLNRKRPDILFSPTHYIPGFCPSGIKRICTIFDLSFLHFPEMFTKKDLWQLKNWTKFSIENADHIVTISNFSKQDIMKQYGISKDKITVAYPGYDREEFRIKNSELRIKQIKKKYKIKDSYIIYIGTIQPRKNLIRLIEAVSRIEGLNLVVVGKTKGEGREGWMYEDILQTPKRLGIEDKVIFTGFVPIKELPYLISGATAFCLPSLWEGFGIPVLEAMACGTPVIVSNVSSLPELVGNAGFLVDPYSVDQIEQAVRTIISDKKLQQKYSKAGIEQAKKFSWEKTTKTVLKVFELI
ncbi:MAG: Group 1 glycosyl transferase [Microgenomates group bacterium Gr01-1014_7]|nr:MAG: Group 1 glycosyl transferase [Microgenomates group bacterium Gr01-1014_7]